MDPREFIKAFKQQPFEPVRVFVSDGAHYDILHPDQVLMTERAAYIGLERNGRQTFQDIARVAHIHVTRIEPLRRTRKRRANRPRRKSR